MGGSSDSGDTQVIQPPSSRDPTLLAVQNPLMSAAIGQLAANDQFNLYGRGSNLTPMAPLGQVYFPGPNQTIIGNPYNPNNLTPFFGQSAAAPQNVGFNSNLQAQGGGQGGGQGQGGGGGGQMGSIPHYAQQVLAPLQQFFPGILPTFGVPSALNSGQTGGSGGSQGGSNQPQQAPQQGQQAPQGNWAYLPGQQQQAPQAQPQQPEPPKQQTPAEQQQAPPAQPQTQSTLSPQEQAMQQQWLSYLTAAGIPLNNAMNGTV